MLARRYNSLSLTPVVMGGSHCTDCLYSPGFMEAAKKSPGLGLPSGVPSQCVPVSAGWSVKGCHLLGKDQAVP